MDFLTGIDLNILLGNIISFIACVIMVLIGFIKNKERFLLMQILQFTLNAISRLFLGAIGGAIGSIISLIRNIIIAKWKCTKALKISLIIIQIALSITTVTFNPITWLPILAAGIFTWYIDTDNIILFKWVVIITAAMWAVYDLFHLNFVSVWFDAFTIASNGWSMVQIKKSRKAEEIK
ncbi:MAG: YgjV family protein [Oscillospiraceae bacterium]|nr:YgjV family protein [Oscillospiraceae bacterium]